MSAEQPTVLPWHKAAANAVDAAYIQAEEANAIPSLDSVAAIVARHDQHAEREAFLVKIANEQGEAMERGNNAIADLKAAHAETLRLLELAADMIAHANHGAFNNGNTHPDGHGPDEGEVAAERAYSEIRAHLAAHSKPAATKEATDCEGCIHRHYVTPDPMGTSRPGWGCLLSGGHATKRCAGYTTHAMKGTQ